MRSNLIRHTMIALIAAAMLAGLGCQSAQVGQPLTREYAGSDPDSQMEFWHRLAQQPVASNDEAFHALLLLMDGKDGAGTYAMRLENLKRRGLLPESFDQSAERAVSRGTVASILVQALEVEGGVMMQLLGPHPRYAIKELTYIGLLPPSSQNQTFSGAELVGMVGLAEDYLRGQGRFAPPGEEQLQEEQGGVTGETRAQAHQTDQPGA